MECLIFSTIRKSSPIARAQLVATVAHTLKCERADGTISVHIIGDTKMTELNRKYRGKNKTTDVLSFPAQEGAWGGKQEQDLGDIFISVAQIRRQAKIWEVSAAEEFTRMLVHGVLHILGYDHISAGEAKIMFAKQERYVRAVLK